MGVRVCRWKMGYKQLQCLHQEQSNETTTTFDLTHKRDKSNIIYQKPIKNGHLDKIKSAFSSF
jgi:hypothetical protein